VIPRGGGRGRGGGGGGAGAAAGGPTKRTDYYLRLTLEGAESVDGGVAGDAGKCIMAGFGPTGGGGGIGPAPDSSRPGPVPLRRVKCEPMCGPGKIDVGEEDIYLEDPPYDPDNPRYKNSGGVPPKGDTGWEERTSRPGRRP